VAQLRGPEPVQLAVLHDLLVAEPHVLIADMPRREEEVHCDERQRGARRAGALEDLPRSVRLQQKLKTVLLYCCAWV